MTGSPLCAVVSLVKRDLVEIESEKEDNMLMEDRSGEGEVVTSLCQSS
jgi:hypothetical protein